MKADIKTRWLEALRSGDYTQGRQKLCQLTDPMERDAGLSYCCLGVLCELAVADGVIEKSISEGSPSVFRYQENTGILPRMVMIWAGLDSDNPNAGEFPLSHSNDFTCLTFNEIADLIEEHL